jgi:hypothetical protein
MTSPTQRSIKMLKDEGWEVAIVEKWNTFARIRQDLFGFADLLAMRPGDKPQLIQVTTTGIASRIEKIMNEPRALTALLSGFEIYGHGWRKIKVKRGGKAMKWEPRIIQVTKDDFPCL